MKKQLILFTFLMVSVLILAGCAQATPDWRTFTGPDGDFAIDMPGDPQSSTSTSDTDVGQVSMNMFTVRVGNDEYIVAFSDYPAELIAAKSVQDFMNDVRDNALNNTSGKLITEQNIELNGYPGRYLNVKSPDGNGIAEARLYLVGNRLYQVFVATPKEEAGSADSQRFLNSFTLMR